MKPEGGTGPGRRIAASRIPRGGTGEESDCAVVPMKPPYGVIPLVRICPGGGQRWPSLPRPEGRDFVEKYAVQAVPILHFRKPTRLCRGEERRARRVKESSDEETTVPFSVEEAD